jgi:hypothetical protein
MIGYPPLEADAGFKDKGVALTKLPKAVGDRSAQLLTRRSWPEFEAPSARFKAINR